MTCQPMRVLQYSQNRCAIAATYVRLAGGFDEPGVSLRTPTGRYRGDPLYAVVARRS